MAFERMSLRLNAFHINKRSGFCRFSSTDIWFFMFFGEIQNIIIATNLDSLGDEWMIMCNIINMKPVNTKLLINNEADPKVCS